MRNQGETGSYLNNQFSALGNNLSVLSFNSPLSNQHLSTYPISITNSRIRKKLPINHTTYYYYCQSHQHPPFKTIAITFSHSHTHQQSTLPSIRSLNKHFPLQVIQEAGHYTSYLISLHHFSYLSILS